MISTFLIILRYPRKVNPVPPFFYRYSCFFGAFSAFCFLAPKTYRILVEFLRERESPLPTFFVLFSIRAKDGKKTFLKILEKDKKGVDFSKFVCYNSIVAYESNTVCIYMQRYFAYGENIRPLHLTSELVDLRVGYAKWIQELCS